jgi:hypothetical protein
VDEEEFEEDDQVGEKVVSKRSSNYMEKEGIALLRAWASVSLDVVTDND